MPPAQYAAAGGYMPRQITNRGTFSQGEHVRSTGKTAATTSYSAKPLRNLTSRNPSRTPVSAHTPSDSESSMISNLEDHVPYVTEMRGTKNGFPELEAQLLPSLRDTIDRMTGGSPRTPRTGTGDGVRNRGTTPKGMSGPRSTPTISGTHHYGLGTNGNSARQYYHDVADDTPATSQLTPTPETSSRSKTPTKSALKSSLRSPSTKTINTSNGTPKLSENVHIATPSPLKSMKTLLTRKCSGKLRSPFTGHKAISDQSQKGPRSHGNEQSVLQHGSLPSDKLASSRYQTSRSDHQSNIPRLRIRFPDNSNNNFYNDDSDFERRFEIESRNRRKLTVTNAEVFGSETSSESDAELKRNAALNSRAAETSRIKYPDASRPVLVGLGFSVAKTTHTEFHVPLKTRDDENRHLNPGKSLRFSLPPSNSGESAYSDDFGNYDAFSAKNGQSRRQESRAPADSDLNLDSRHPMRFPLQRHVQENNIAYFPVPSHQFLSRSPEAMSSLGNEDQETESEREGYSIRLSRADLRRRSSSCDPSFRASPEEATYDVYDELTPPRPRSSCQRHIAREEHTPDREFPQSLKEIIKQRNSFSKPSVHPEYREYSPRKQRSTDELDGKRGRKGKPVATSPRSAAMVVDPGDNQSYVRHRLEGQERWPDTNSDNESFRSIATRERLAFGIPPSESDEVFSNVVHEPELSHAESDMSSINECIWRRAPGYEYEMDTNADRMLSKLGDVNVEKERQRTQKHAQNVAPRLNIISPTLSSESLTTKEREALLSVSQGNGFEKAQSNLRTTTEEPIGHQGSIEISQTREGVIQEIFESEEDLLQLLRLCMRLFVIPLRVQNSRTWITGVPPTIARLFDWFDDIVHLHEQIYGALCSARDTMSPATDRVSESLRWFVLKIEVYQPYLVKLADARVEIQGAREDQKCDLGQFIRLQEMNRDCQGWTLEQLLMLPVNRLASCQDLFAHMLDLTPKTHQDYLSTLSLSRSTDIALKVMTEVKAREDEYQALKEFSSQIQGLPTQNHLATRDRRLLHSGRLQLVISNLHELPTGSATSPGESKRISRSSKLLDAIAKSPRDFAKSAINSGSSWVSSGNDEGSAISTSSPSKVSWFSRLPLRRRSRVKSPPQVVLGDTPTAPTIDLRTVDVHAFVFNDLVLLVQQNRSNVPEPSWILSEDVGIFRPLSIARLKRRNAQEGMILSLEVATVDALGLNDTFDFRSSSWRIVDLLLLPPPSRGMLSDQVDANSESHFQPWLNSLRQCCKQILRKLTFISCPNQSENSLLGSDRLIDTHLVVSSLTASGLPIPRSPSGSLPETCPAGSDRARELSDEREERGWWSLRYQQVFREFQRQDSGILDDEED